MSAGIGLRPEVERTPNADGALLVRGTVRVQVDHVVMAVLDGTLHASTPFRMGVRAALGRLGLLDGVDIPEQRRPVTDASGPLVSVIIPNKDGETHLRGVLRSLAEQTYKEFEVIVVDGGSIDASTDVAGAAGARVVAVPTGTGFSAACNAGAAQATGTFLLILNNDTLLEPDFVAQLVRAAEAGGEDVAAVAPMVRRGDMPVVIESLGNVLGTRGFGAGRFAGIVDLGQFPDGEELFSAPFTATLLRRSVWDAIGAMDERFDFYYEDIEWCIRARLAGYRVLSAPHAIVYHEGSATLGEELSPEKLRMVTANRLLWAAGALRKKTAARFVAGYIKEDLGRIRSSLPNQGSAGRAVFGAWLQAASRAPETKKRRQATIATHDLPMKSLFALAEAPPPYLTDSGSVLVTEQVVRSMYVTPTGAWPSLPWTETVHS